VRVVDAAGAPIVGAEIAVLDDMPDLRPGLRRGAVRPPRTAGATDTDGAYVVGADVPSAGALRVRATGFAEKTVGLEPFPTEIRLTPSRNLRVRVIDERGKAIPGATVRAVGPLRDAEVTTDADGRVDLLADGTDWRRLEVFADGFRIEQHDTTLRALPRADPITVVLHAARPLVGRVVADEDGNPLEGATVTLVTGAVERGTFATTTTRADGSFALGIGMPSYRVYALEVTAPDRLPAFVSVSPVDAWEKPPEIRLDRGRPVDGIVTEGWRGPARAATPAYARTTNIAEREATTSRRRTRGSLPGARSQGRRRCALARGRPGTEWRVGLRPRSARRPGRRAPRRRPGGHRLPRRSRDVLRGPVTMRLSHGHGVARPACRVGAHPRGRRRRASAARATRRLRARRHVRLGPLPVGQEPGDEQDGQRLG
jgi:hypothetical protein